MDSRPASILGVLVIVCVIASAAAVAQSGYAISSTESTSVPERTFDLQGESHTVDSRISVAPGAAVSVDVAAPDEVYRVYLYNGDQQIVDRQRGDGDGSFTFDLSGYEPGSYAITAHSRETDQHEAVMPVLVEGYDVTVDGPSSVSADESFDVTITMSEGAASGDPASVSAVLASDGDEHTVTASGGDGEYTASVAAEDLDAGEYNVYGVVQGTDEAFDRDELLGLAEGSSLTVGEANETEGTDGGAADGGNGSDGGAAGGATTPGTERPGGPSTATASMEGTATASPTDGTATTGEGGAITPGDSETTVPATEVNGPGFGGLHLAVALGAILAVVLARRRGEA